MSSINSFGSVMAFAINSESQLQAYYEALGNTDRAKETDKRRAKLERIRRENIVEITLEPIDGLDEADYPFDWGDTSESGQKHNESLLAQFLADAAPKINVLPAQRALERCGQEHANNAQ
jgi:hypothetical protein